MSYSRSLSERSETKRSFVSSLCSSLNDRRFLRGSK